MYGKKVAETAQATAQARYKTECGHKRFVSLQKKYKHMEKGEQNIIKKWGRGAYKKIVNHPFGGFF